MTFMSLSAGSISLIRAMVSLTAVADVHDVGVGGPVDLETHGLVSVQPVEILFDGIIVGHAGHIGDGQALVADRQVFHVFQDLQLAGDAGHIAGLSVFHIPGRNVDIVVADGVDQVVRSGWRRSRRPRV